MWRTYAPFSYVYSAHQPFTVPSVDLAGAPFGSTVFDLCHCVLTHSTASDVTSCSRHQARMLCCFTAGCSCGWCWQMAGSGSRPWPEASSPCNRRWQRTAAACILSPLPCSLRAAVRLLAAWCARCSSSAVPVSGRECMRPSGACAPWQQQRAVPAWTVGATRQFACSRVGLYWRGQQQIAE